MHLRWLLLNAAQDHAGKRNLAFRHSPFIMQIALYAKVLTLTGSKEVFSG